MDKSEIIASIAYCGLICKLCHLGGECGGCRSEKNQCHSHSEREKGCYHIQCCRSKGLNGCWECAEFPCDKQMFVGRTKGEIIGFCRCIKEDGPECFVDFILKNQKKGIPYGAAGYGGKEDGEVLLLLRGRGNK